MIKIPISIPLNGRKTGPSGGYRFTLNQNGFESHDPSCIEHFCAFFGGDKSIGDIYGVVFSELVYILFLLAAVTHMVVEVCVSGFKPGPNWTSAVLNWLSNPYLAFWPPCSPGHEC